MRVLLHTLLAVSLLAGAPSVRAGERIFAPISAAKARTLIAKAEGLLSQGKYEPALEELYGAMGEDEHRGEFAVKGDAALTVRLYVLGATAALSCGDTSLGLTLIEHLRRAEPQSAALQLLAASAHAQEPATVAQAQKELEALAAANQLRDAADYATLARLRLLAKDLKGAAEARGRCQQLAKTPAVCEHVVVPKQVRDFFHVNWRSYMLSTAWPERGGGIPTFADLYARELQVLVHDPGGDRKFDFAGWAAEHQRILKGPRLTISEKTQFSLAAAQRPGSVTYEVRFPLLLDTGAVHERRERLLRLSHQDGKVQVLYEELFPATPVRSKIAPPSPQP